jgi:hypothetical protein
MMAFPSALTVIDRCWSMVLLATELKDLAYFYLLHRANFVVTSGRRASDHKSVAESPGADATINL